MLGVSDDTDDLNVELGVGTLPVTDQAPDGALWIAEILAGKGRIHHRYVRLANHVLVGESPSRQYGKLQGREVAGGYGRHFHVHVFVVFGVVAGNGEVAADVVACQFGIVGAPD